MESKWLFIFHERTKQLWFRASLYCLFAVVTALLGVIFNDNVPEPLHNYVKPQAAQQILEIMASSMLVVATFALSVMVQAYGAAATTATPRATQLLTERSSAQNALAAFIGAFLFSVAGLIALSAEIYGPGGAVILFTSTILVVVLVVVMLLRWIEQLSRLGRVEDSITLVESATRDALLRRARMPFLGGQPLLEPPINVFPVTSPVIGYVQYIDMEKLQHIAKRHDIEIYVEILPGSFCDLVHPFASTNKKVNSAVAEAINEALVIGHNRTFPQDPRFGFVALAEIALRAMSPSVNDPGTAIGVVGTSVRLFHDWASDCCQQPEGAPVFYDRVWVAGLQEEDFFDDFFPPVIRDAAGFREVCIRLEKALRAIAEFGFRPYEEPARLWSGVLLQRCKRQLTESEFRRVKGVTENAE
jgi:uncharacterized membrane protein